MRDLHVLTGLAPSQLATVVRRLRVACRSPGRPYALALERRVLIACTSLRTNATVRELAATFEISRSQAHRIVADLTERIARLLCPPVDRRWSWVVDGTLVPTRDHQHAAKSKNYRWSCNAQILIRRADLCVLAAEARGPGNRNDPVHYRGSQIEQLCRHHGRVLADGGYRGINELVIPRFRGRRILRNAAWRAIGAVAHASSTRSPGSRIGASFGIIAAAVTV
jgi:hypothetical protein